MRENRNSGGWKFWLGLMAGAAAGFYLNSDKGRRFRQESNERLNHWGRDVSSRALTELEQLSIRASEALERSKGLADRTRMTIKDKINQFSSAAENVVDKTEQSYERAADWASAKLSRASDQQNHEEEQAKLPKAEGKVANE